MRSEIEIIRAHDVLTAVANGEVPAKASDPISDAGLRSALDALCWVLKHDNHGHAFAGNLAFIEEELSKRGYVLRKMN